MTRSKELGRGLGLAVMKGHMPEVLKLLSAGADLEIQVPVLGMMMSPLNAAAYTNQVRCHSTSVAYVVCAHQKATVS